jgi:hypothetical protein
MNTQKSLVKTKEDEKKEKPRIKKFQKNIKC